MAVGKFQPFVKGDTIYAMDTETGALWEYDEKKVKDWDGDTEQNKGWYPLYATKETMN